MVLFTRKIIFCSVLVAHANVSYAQLENRNILCPTFLVIQQAAGY